MILENMKHEVGVKFVDTSLPYNIEKVGEDDFEVKIRN